MSQINSLGRRMNIQEMHFCWNWDISVVLASCGTGKQSGMRLCIAAFFRSRYIQAFCYYCVMNEPSIWWPNWHLSLTLPINILHHGTNSFIIHSSIKSYTLSLNTAKSQGCQVQFNGLSGLRTFQLWLQWVSVCCSGLWKCGTAESTPPNLT
jgi:hypothetical protein